MVLPNLLVPICASRCHNIGFPTENKTDGPLFQKPSQRLIITVINQPDAQNFRFTISLFHASTCFEHMFSSSRDQNCITQPLVSSHSVGGRPVHRCTGRPPEA